MAGNRRIFIDDSYFYMLSTGVNVNIIEFIAIPNMAVHAGTISGLQTLSLQGTVLTEIAVADIDNLTSIGKYCVTTGNSIQIAVDAMTIDTAEKAKNYITGMLLVYQMVSLTYSGTDTIYTMETFADDGTFIGSTKSSSLTTLNDKMVSLDKDQDVNSSTGRYYHILSRAVTAA